MVKLNPVSYTHLDVYKRQLYSLLLQTYGYPVCLRLHKENIAIRFSDLFGSEAGIFPITVQTVIFRYFYYAIFGIDML